MVSGRQGRLSVHHGGLRMRSELQRRGKGARKAAVEAEVSVSRGAEGSEKLWWWCVCVSWGVSKSECLVSCRLRHCSIQEKGGERERESNRHEVWGGGTQRKRDRERGKGGRKHECLFGDDLNPLPTLSSIPLPVFMLLYIFDFTL